MTATTAPAACIIGWPVDHSRSPLIHNYWLKTYGIAGEYRREAVAPGDFGAFIQSLAGRGYVGANVTVPHKEAALALSQLSMIAPAVGGALTRYGSTTDCARPMDRRRRLPEQSRCLRPAGDRNLAKTVVLGAMALLAPSSTDC